MPTKKRADGRYARSFRLPDGTRKYVYGRTRVEADQKLREARSASERGQLVQTSKQKLADYLDYWLSVKRLTIEPTTEIQYRSRIRRIVAVLGSYPLQKLSQTHIQRFIGGLVDEGLAPGTIGLLYHVLQTALNDAVEWKLIAFNPCGRGVKLPKIEEVETVALDEVQAQALLQVVAGSSLEALVTLALATGLRYGELSGLKWSDVEWERGVLRVQRQLVFLNGIGYQERAPKTRSSRRSIVLAPFALSALSAHRTRQKAQRMQVGPTIWENRDLIFCNGKGGYLSHTTLLRHFKQVLEQAELPPMRFHDLRHSFATLLLKMRVPGKVVQELLGHSSIKTTMDKYGHVLMGMQSEAIADLNGLFSEGKRDAR